jgi:hypothetical protein
MSTAHHKTLLLKLISLPLYSSRYGIPGLFLSNKKRAFESPSATNGEMVPSADRTLSAPATERRSSGTRWAAFQNWQIAQPPVRPGPA